MSAFPDSVRWFSTVLLVTLACAPVARLLAARLPDRGAFIASPIGLLTMIWPIWFLASVSPVPFTTAGLWITTAVVAAVGWGVLYRNGGVDRAWLAHLAVAQLIALVAFAGYIWLRGYTPQINSTEKPMDMALLASSARATEMPPPDPWMAGETINYYYLGYLQHGSLARMSGVPTWVGFNLALATVFAMSITTAAGLGYNIVRTKFGLRLAIAAGALTSFLVVLAGNLKAPLEFVRNPESTWNTFWWQGIGWQSSRVVVDNSEGITINEFPSFSFILGDLHPHVMALPFTMVALTIAINLLYRPQIESGSKLTVYGPIALSGAVIGSLYPLNSWDYPTYLLAAIVALLFAYGWTKPALFRILALGVASIAAWIPFWVTFVPFAGGNEEDISDTVRAIPVLGRIATTVSTYSGNRTSAGEFLTIFGLPWLIAVVILGIEIGRRGRGKAIKVPRSAVVISIVVSIVALGLPAPVLILAGAPVAAALWLLINRDPDDLELPIITSLIAAGFALVLVTEFFYIRDDFGNRMNTLFKVYYQVWTLIGVAAAISLIRLWRYSSRSPRGSGLLGIAFAALFLIGGAYPVISAETWTEWQGPRDWKGLDASAYIDRTAPDDLASIHWLNENAEEGDVVLEAPGCSYTVNSGVPTGRIATFTGVPNIMGWTGHERQWRGGQPRLLTDIGERVQEIQTLYADPSDIALLDRYGVTLLYIGSFERNGTDQCESAGPFAAVMESGYPGEGWNEVFSSGDSRIYRRISQTQ